MDSNCWFKILRERKMMMMFPLQACIAPKPSNLHASITLNFNLPRSFSSIFPQNSSCSRTARLPSCFPVLTDSVPAPEPDPKPGTRTRQRRKPEVSLDGDTENEKFPRTIPRRQRRGRRSEAAAVEDFVRDSLERTFTVIREKNPEVFENTEKAGVMKEKDPENDVVDDGEEEEDEEKMVVEEENPNWPLDAEVGWGIKASEYFEKHPIKNVVGDDGFEIDWEGEAEDNWVQEINCLEWESFAFHPSPLVVLVFERYNRASDNWRTLKELEKAIKVYWNAKDRLPPRAVKIDMNIERDLAYALKAKECPQILFLRGNRILYREKELRTADELVHMIAHFYYNAKRPSWINDAAVFPRY